MLTDFQDLKIPEQEDYLVEAAQQKGGKGVVLTQTHRQSRLMLYVLLAAILFVNFAVLYCVRRRMKREMDE